MSGPAVYLDASAIVKLVLPESGTEDLVDYLGSRPTRLTSAISPVEVGRAVLRRFGGQVAIANSVFEDIVVMDLTAAITSRAASVEPRALRALDAIHLVSAIELGAELAALITYDRRLADAARHAGLPVASPGIDL